MKIGKEIKTDYFKNYNVIFGSVNNKKSKAIFINISAWGEPKNIEEDNYNRVIRDINKKVKQLTYNLLSQNEEIDFLINRTIVDLDIRESGIRYGKRSFMNCEITLFLANESQLNTDTMKNKLNYFTKNIINLTFDENDFFKFYKRKN